MTEENRTVETADAHEELADCGSSEDVEMRNMLRSQNRKKKSGGFQSMGSACAYLKNNIK